MCGSADVGTGKMRIFAADIECGCVGKKRMCGCDWTFTLKVSCLLFVSKLAGLSLSRVIGLCANE